MMSKLRRIFGLQSRTADPETHRIREDLIVRKHDLDKMEREIAVIRGRLPPSAYPHYDKESPNG